MVIAESLVGLKVEGVKHDVDRRWTMAFAAALGDHLDTYVDTTRPEGIVAHPLFAVCPEWPAIVASRNATRDHGLTAAEVLTSVHATHDTTIHRLIRPGDELTTSLEIVALEQIRPGAKSTMRLTTVDVDGLPVATTSQEGIYLAQPYEGPAQSDPEPPASLKIERQGEPFTTSVAVAAGAAHTYTDCARIWNPIHTDKEVALASGLPDIILHGTANLAHGVSAVLTAHAAGRPELVRRIRGRFAAMVQMPSELIIHVWPKVAHGEMHAVPFEVLNEGGAPAVKDGVVLLGPSAAS